MQGLNPIVMMAMMFGAMYFLMIRPQVRRQKEHRAMLDKLGPSDLVVTRGGTIGRVLRANGDLLIIEIQDEVRCAIPRAYVDAKWDGSAPDALRYVLREPA